MPELIETLVANAGRNEGEAVGSYGRSIVFLPKETPINRHVRVRLIELAKRDARDRAMYRGEPAPDVPSERWKDNGDGTASRITILTDWLNQESEIGVVETRQLATREGTHTTRSDYRVVWGDSFVSSVVEDHQIEVIPTEREYVFHNTILWKKVSERSGPRPTFQFPITELRVNNANHWWMARYVVTWAPELAVLGEVFFKTSGGQVLRTDILDTFGGMPNWWKKEQEAKFPVCSCGRTRRDAVTSDGYAKCEICRKEEHCARCSQQKTVQLVAGKLLCSTCKPLEETEQEVTNFFAPEGKAAIAAQAKRLRSGQAFPQEEGMMILRATMDHIPSEWDRNRFLDRWKTYLWFYFCEDAVYGTKLAPTALQLLEYLPHGSGDGLIDMACWIAQGPEVYGNVTDYYVTTQVEGRTFSPGEFDNRTGKVLGNCLDSLGEDAVTGKMVIAARLRGAEAERIAAIQGYARLSEKLGKDQREVKQIAEILQGNEQDYAKAVALIQKIDAQLAERQAAIDAGAVWPDVLIDISTRSRVATDVFAIGSNGLVIDPVPEATSGRKSRVYGYRYGDIPNSVLVVEHSHDNYAYQDTERWEVHYLPAKVSEAQRTTLRRLQDETRHYFTGPGTGWDLRQVGSVVFSTAYHRDFEGVETQSDNEMRSMLPIDITQWEQSVADNGTIIVGPYRRRSKETKAVQEAETRELEARGMAMTLEYEKEEAQGIYTAAEAKWIARDEVRDGSQPVEEGTVFLVPAFVREDREGREDFVFGPFFDWVSGTQVKLVLDPFSGEGKRMSEQNQNVLVRVRSRNSDQVHLFETFLRPQAGGHKQRTLGYFVIPVLSPEDFDRQIAEAEEQHKAAEAVLEKAKRAVDYVVAKKRREQEEVRTIAEAPQTFFSTETETVNPLAEALRRAGLGK